MNFYDGYGNQIDIEKIDCVTEKQVKTNTIYTPFGKNGYMKGSSVTYEAWKNAIATNMFFNAPRIQPQNEDSEIYKLYEICGDYDAINTKGLETGTYYFYFPTEQYQRNVDIIISTDSTLEAIYENALNDNVTYTKISLTYEDLSTIATNSEMGWETLYLKMLQFTVPSGYYGYIHVPLGMNTDFQTGANGETHNYYHLSKEPLQNPICYDDVTQTDFDSISSMTKDVYVGTGYPRNTLGKSFVLGGDSGVSYGKTEIFEEIKNRCGMYGYHYSLAGSIFSGTEKGGGIYMRDHFHALGGYPDVVLLCWGGNNDLNGVGTVTADYMEDGETIPTTTLGALRYIVEDIRTLSPDTMIIGWIPYQMNLDGSWEWRKEKYDQIREGYKLLSIPVIDAFYESGIVPRDMMNYDGGGISSDNGHPSTYGKKRIAKLIANTIIRYV